jgi:hypothetical protein
MGECKMIKKLMLINLFSFILYSCAWQDTEDKVVNKTYCSPEPSRSELKSECFHITNSTSKGNYIVTYTGEYVKGVFGPVYDALRSVSYQREVHCSTWYDTDLNVSDVHVALPVKYVTFTFVDGTSQNMYEQNQYLNEKSYSQKAANMTCDLIKSGALDNES